MRSGPLLRRHVPRSAGFVQTRNRCMISPATPRNGHDLFILLNRGPAKPKTIIAALIETYCRPFEVKGLTDPASKILRSKIQSAINYLLNSGLIERELRKGPLYLTDEGYDFLRKLNPQAVQALSSEVEPRFKAHGKARPKPPWRSDPD